MCITMSFCEFEKYLKTHRSTKILFASCDQQFFDGNCSINFYMEFYKIVTQESKNLVILVGTSCRMCIKEIISITVDDSCSVLGSVAEISCGYRDNNLNYKICLCD